jgi:hypothetical protein
MTTPTLYKPSHPTIFPPSGSASDLRQRTKVNPQSIVARVEGEKGKVSVRVHAQFGVEEDEREFGSSNPLKCFS